MIHSLGLLPSTPAKVAHRVAASTQPEIRAALVAGPSSGTELVGCPILQQRQSGTCHAHSAAASRWVAQNAAGKPLLWIPSPKQIASLTYADTQRVGPAPTEGWPTLQDLGAELQDGANAIATWGIGPIGASPDGELGDVPNDPADNSFPEPDLDNVEVSWDLRGDKEYSIVMDPQTVVAVAAAALDAKMPIRTGFNCDRAFQDLGPNDVAQAPDPANVLGGHSTYLRAHRVVNGSRQFRLSNSWGTSWCDSGEVWASEAWLVACWDLFPVPAV
jgi:hypothetical protein